MGRNLTLFQKGIVLISIPIAYQLLSLALFITIRQENTRVEGLAAQSREVKANAERVYRLVIDAQNGVRGYLLTGSGDFLTPYHAAVAELPGQMTAWSEGTADPGQQDRADEVISLIRQRLAELEQERGLQQSGRRDEAITHIKENGVQSRMSDVRRHMEGFLAEQDRLDRERSEAWWKTWRRQNRILVGAAVLTVLLAVAVNLLFSRTVDRRLQVVLGKALRQAGGQDAEPPLEGTDELAQLDQAYSRMAQAIRERSRELSTANESLRQSNRELEQFASVASHDLQEPLRKIEAFADRLKVYAAPGENTRVLEYVDRILASTRRMRTLITDLLTYSRVSTRALPFVHVDLGQVAREVLADLEERVKEADGRVEIGPLPALEADALQMRQIVQNLVGNALKFRRPGVASEVRLAGETTEDPGGPVAADRPGPWCRLTVTDNGIGFEDVYKERIFEVFQRLHGRGEYEGTGMGLAICRKIVERHGGRISAAGRSGQGAVFEVVLPMRQLMREGANGLQGAWKSDGADRGR